MNKSFAKFFSVIIVTRNRPKQIVRCLEALELNTFKRFEVIIVDQSDLNYIPNNLIQKIKKLKGKYLKSKTKGKSRGLNEGLKVATGEALVFTDDDCIPNKYWLKNIYQTFLNNPKVSGIFGRTLPYRPTVNRNLICACTFLKTRPRNITKPEYHAEYIGLGNNMSIKKKVFFQIDGFKEWLGPGSVGKAAEDAEISLRLLTADKILFYNPKIIVYHNNWLTVSQYNKLLLSYICGEIACYGFYYFRGYKFAKKIIINNLKDSVNEFVLIFDSLIRSPRMIGSLIYIFISRLMYKIRGIGVGCYFYLKESID